MSESVDFEKYAYKLEEYISELESKLNEMQQYIDELENANYITTKKTFGNKKKENKNDKIKILNNNYYYLGTGKRGAKIYICFKKDDKEYEKNKIILCYYDEETKKMKNNYTNFNDKFKTKKDLYEYFSGCDIAFGGEYVAVNGEKVIDIQRQISIFFYFIDLYNTKLKNVWGKDNFNYIRLRDKIYRELKKLIKN